MPKTLFASLMIAFLLAVSPAYADDSNGSGGGFFSGIWDSVTSLLSGEYGDKAGDQGDRSGNAGNTATATQTVTVNDTSIFANLPPDPGPAGKATLAGIDSDNDGVRDDVQRWIVFNFPNSAKTRAALRQLAQDYQRFILGAANPTQIYDAARLMDNTQSCLEYIGDGYTLGGLLKAQMLNTHARSKAFLQANRHLSGRMYKGLPYNQWKQGCNFNPDAMPN